MLSILTISDTTALRPVCVITQGMFHHDKRVIQKPSQTNHLVESAPGTMLSDVCLSEVLTLPSHPLPSPGTYRFH